MKSSISPKTGGKLVTLASDDQSFEFHVKVDEVSKIVFVETAKPSDDGEKVLRICRFMNKEGGSICSLILNEAGEEAVQWFGGMQKRYGDC
jgi:putative heme iron utilization protein